jgi:hypothetical protein
MTTDKFRSSKQTKPKTNSLVKVQVKYQPEQVRLVNKIDQSNKNLISLTRL